MIADLGCFGVCHARAVLVGHIVLELGLLDLALVHAVKVEGNINCGARQPLRPRDSSSSSPTV